MRDSESLPLSIWRRVNRVCETFEAAWRAGERPRLEAFLEAASGAEGVALLEELLRLELHYRSAAGESATVEEYRDAFRRRRRWSRASLPFNARPGLPPRERRPAPAKFPFPTCRGMRSWANWAGAEWASFTRPGS